MIFWRLFFFKMFLSTSFANSAFYKKYLEKIFVKTLLTIGCYGYEMTYLI